MCSLVCLEVTCYCGGEVTLFAAERLLSIMNQHVCFQMSSFGGWVATLKATLGLPSIMLKHVRFEVFGIVEGETALITGMRCVFTLYFHGLILLELVICYQSSNKVGNNWRLYRVFPMWKWFWKVKVREGPVRKKKVKKGDVVPFGCSFLVMLHAMLSISGYCIKDREIPLFNVMSHLFIINCLWLLCSWL